MVGIAIVGRGGMGRAHARAWSELGLGENIRYVVSRQPGAMLEDAPAARSTTDLDEVLRDPDIDVVSVCTPTTTHAGIAVRALRAGKNVLLEKPIALEPSDAIAIRDAAAQSPGILMVAHVVRFFGGYRALRDAVTAGETGTVLSVRAERLSGIPGPSPWWHDEAQSGGMLVDFAIHDFDQLNLFLGTPVSVSARRGTASGPIEVSVDYAGGGLGQVTAFMGLAEGFAFSSSIELLGTTALAEYRFTGALSEAGSNSDLSEAGSSSLEGRPVLTREVGRPLDFDARDPYAIQAEYFLDCVAGGAEPELAPADSAIEALVLSLAARESLATGRPVAVPSVHEITP
jgi:predicted dehydrogenase